MKWIIVLEVESDNESIRDPWHALGMESPSQWNFVESTQFPDDIFVDVIAEKEIA